MNDASAASDHVIVERSGAIVTLTFNRPEARNAMTWEMYERLYQTCEEVDGDDSIRVLVLKGAGGKAFVAGTDIGQFAEFKDGEDGLRYERDSDRRTFRVARVKKPVIAQIQGFAVGGGLGIAAGADLRVATPESRFGAPIARTLGNCLSMQAYARYLDLFGPSRLKELIFTARLLDRRRGARRRLRPRDRRCRGDRGARPRAGRDRRLARADHAVGHEGGGAAASRRRAPCRTATTWSPRPMAAQISTKACAPSWRSGRRAGPDARTGLSRPRARRG